MKTKTFWARTGMAATAMAFAAGAAYAAVVPTLSLSSAGGNSVTVNVSGDANATVILYYNVGSSSGTQSMTVGTTNANGYLSTVVNGYNMTSGQNAYVVVDGQQSTMQAWPMPTGSPSLSQSSLSLGVGQSVSVYAQGGSAAIYLASNTNPSVASAQVSGTQISISAKQTGSTNISVCYVGTASNCANLGVTVQTGSVLGFSQSNISLGVGQGSTVTVSGGNGAYTITANASPNVASAVISGSTITVSALTTGTTNVTACDSSGNCGTLYVTVTTVSANGSLYFSITNPSLSVGQTATVTVSGGSSYYVTGNSNTSVASQVLNGNTLTINGLASGSTLITVCSASNGCGTLSVNVGAAATTQVSFGIPNPTVALGQTMNISLSGGTGSGYYVSSNVNTAIVQATVNGSSLSLYGAGAGSDSLVVCATGGGCSTLSVMVSGSGQTTTSSGSGQTGSQISSSGSATVSAVLAVIQSMQNQLAQIVTQIQSMATALSSLKNSVAASSGTTSSSSGSGSSVSSSVSFTEFLSVGSQDAEVTALQQYLSKKGYYHGAITGYYGTETEAAVKSYQTAHGITAAGYVGPSTRAALNAGQ